MEVNTLGDEPAAVFTLYTDINSLFDTRLGKLQCYYPDVAANIDKKYWDRKYLNWAKFTRGAVTNDMLDSKPDGKDVLMASYCTSVHLWIAKAIAVHRDNVLRDLVDKPLTLMVDTYGYDLTEEEKQDIGECLLGAVGDSLLKVAFIEVGLKNLTPEYVDKNIGGMLLYDGCKWLEMHRDALMGMADKTRSVDGLTNTLSGVSLNVPMMYGCDVEGVSSKDEKIGYQLFRTSVHAYISLDYLPVGMFSACVTPEKAA